MNGAYSLRLVTLYSGQFISLLGDRIYMIALTFLLARQHPIDLTILWVVNLVAPMLVSLISGTIIDRLGFLRSAIICDASRAILTALMPFSLHTPIALFFLVFLVSAAGPVFGQAVDPMIQTLAAEEIRHQVNSINSTLSSTAMFLGPLLGGVLLLQSQSLPFLLQSASFVVSVIALLAIRFPAPPKPEGSAGEKPKSVFWSDVQLGFKYVMGNSTLVLLMWLATLVNLGGGAVDAYEVLFVTHALHLGSAGYAGIVSGSGLAFIFAGLLNSRYGKRFKPTTLVALGPVLIVAGLIPYSLSINFATALTSLVIFAIGFVTTVTVLRTIRQSIVPTEIMGRVGSVMFVIPLTAASLSVVIGGILLPYLSIRHIITGAAVVELLTLPIGYRLWRQSKTPKPESSELAV